MSAAVWAAVFAGLTFVLTLFGVVFLGGKLTQKVDENTDGLRELRTDHSGRLTGVEAKVNLHEVSLGRLHEWKDGFNAGARKIGNGEARD
jgi:hypothetical protein